MLESYEKYAELTGFTYRTIKKRFRDAGLEHAGKSGKRFLFESKDALPVLYGNDFQAERLNLEQERALLAQEQTRRLKRENDEAEGKLLRRELFVELLQDASRQAVSLLETIPLDLKRRFPETKTREIEFVKLTIAKVRNAIAAIRVGK